MQDDRFNDSMDKVTGYTTHSIACLPFFNHQVEVICLYSSPWSLLFQGEVAGVAQIVNKKSGPEFTKADIEVSRLDFVQSSYNISSRYLRSILPSVGWGYRMLNFLRPQSWNTRRTSYCWIWQNHSSKNSPPWTAWSPPSSGRPRTCSSAKGAPSSSWTWRCMTRLVELFSLSRNFSLNQIMILSSQGKSYTIEFNTWVSPI